MKRLLATLCLPLILCAGPLSSWAGDDHDDDDDHRYRHHHHRHYQQHRHRHHERKEEFWDGRCKVERKWKKNGEYKEKRKCQDHPVSYHQPRPMYAPPQPVYVAPRPPEGLLINSQIYLR